VQTIRARLETPASLQKLLDYAEADPRLKLDVKSESAFYARQSQGIGDLILDLGWPLAIAMSFGALAGALNTMYASVDARTREIATMRAIGFGSLPAFIGTMTESLLLSAVGGVVGSLGTYLLFDGISAATLGSNFTQVVFALKLSPQLVVQGVFLALIIGLAGGFFPALRAARIPLLAAFRDP
jgi:putative ABC transport system permease protein